MMGFGDDFLDMTLKIQIMKKCIGWDSLKLIVSVLQKKKQENEKTGAGREKYPQTVFLIILFFLKLRPKLK